MKKINTGLTMFVWFSNIIKIGNLLKIIIITFKHIIHIHIYVFIGCYGFFLLFGNINYLYYFVIF